MDATPVACVAVSPQSTPATSFLASEASFLGREAAKRATKSRKVYAFIDYVGNWDSVSRVLVFRKSHPHELFPCSKILSLFVMLSLRVILRSCITSLKVLNYYLEDHHREESPRLCPFYLDYTNGVGRLCVESVPMID